jgi:TolA-binding protein
LAEAALRQDHPAEAEKMLTALEAEAQGPADPEGFVRLVRGRHVQSLLGLKRWKDAFAKAEALKLELSPEDPAVAELDFARGRALLGLARPDEARAALQSVIDARKGSDLAAQAHLMRGETYFHQERYHEALTEFLKVDVLYDAPGWQAAALLEAGKVYERLVQWDDAAETYERLCARFPNDFRAAEAKDRLEAARKHGSARSESAGKVF